MNRSAGNLPENFWDQVILTQFFTLITFVYKCYIISESPCIVDLTFVDPKLSWEEFDWQVSSRYRGSDHEAIVYQLQTSRKATDTSMQTKKEKWALATFNRDTFLRSLEVVQCKETAEDETKDLMRVIMAACKALMVKQVDPHGRPLVYGETRKKQEFEQIASELESYTCELFADQGFNILVPSTN